MSPKTVKDWRKYIKSLPVSSLPAKARAANTLGFVRQLQEEEYSAKEIEAVLLLFAVRLNEERLEVPTHGAGMYLSYGELLESRH